MPSDRLPVLMYHKVKLRAEDAWTVTPAELDRQWNELRAWGYRPITCAELIGSLDGRPLPPKPLLITFDDAYANVLEHAYPLLARHGLRATIFLPVGFLGAHNGWDGGSERLLGYEELRQMSPELIEFGIHSYAHRNYRRMRFEEIAADLQQCSATLSENQLRFVPALAYPYGGYPRGIWHGRRFSQLLSRLGIACGLRVGNRVNRLPLPHRYAIRRIDVRRDDTVESLRRRLGH